MSYLLFVYGTLLSGCRNHSRLPGGAKLVRNGHLKGRLHLSNQFPFLVLTDDDSTLVKGEIYEVNDFAQSDYLEGFHEKLKPEECHFLRVMTKTVEGDDVFVYIGGHYYQKNIQNFKQLPTTNSIFNWKYYELGQWSRVEPAFRNSDDITQTILRRFFADSNPSITRLHDFTKLDLASALSAMVEFIKSGCEHCPGAK